MKECNHWEGDNVNGYWLCAKCFAKLEDRPRRYRMGGVEDGDVPPRQEVIMAPVAEADGTSLFQFVTAMALRLIASTGGGFNKTDALEYAIEILRAFGEPFGSDDLDWTSGGPWELVDEDMQYWDHEGVGGNQ